MYGWSERCCESSSTQASSPDDVTPATYSTPPPTQNDGPPLSPLHALRPGVDAYTSVAGMSHRDPRPAVGPTTSMGNVVTRRVPAPPEPPVRPYPTMTHEGPTYFGPFSSVARRSGAACTVT